MQRQRTRHSIPILSVTCLLMVMMISSSMAADFNARHRFSIPAQPLSAALLTFSAQSGIQIMTASADLRDLMSSAISGEKATKDALSELLVNTGMRFQVISSDAVAIEPIKPRELTQSGASAEQRNAEVRLAQTGTDTRPSGDSTRTGERSAAEGASSSVSSASANPRLDEIIVTAQKKSERLQDVPVPVTVINADKLVDNNQLQLQDYYTQIPGLALTVDSSRGTPQIAIRGITTGFANPTVGITVDDVPYGSSTALGLGTVVPDLDPGDLARIEVLRGPQGTLYGASSIGGLLKYVTADPSMDGVSGRIQAGTSGVYNGAQPGYNVRGSINVPLSDTVAIRASAFTRQDPGYIDDPGLQVKGVNWGEADGGHVAALWRPSSVFSLKLSALVQDYTLHGSNDVDLLPGLGDLQQSDAVRNVGGHATQLQAYSATLMAKLGTAELTSVTGYNVTHLTDSFDYTYALGSLTHGIFGVMGTPFFEDGKTTKYSEELRLSVPIGQRLEWLFGVFYTHESSLVQQDFVAENPSTGAIVGTGYSGPFPTTYAEYAGFTDLTYRFTDQFDVQIGGRESGNRQTYSQTIVGPFDPAFFGSPSPVVNPEVVTKDNSFTYLVTPRFKISPELMVYARLASGYRPGGPNSESLIYGVPAEFKPDRTENYEIGVKGDVLDHVLSFDASLYYIDWKNIQLEVTEPTGSFESNGSGAKSQGLELSVESRPLQSLTIGAWVAFSDAVLTQNLPSNSANYGLSGNRLPNSSRFTGNLSLEEDFPLPGGITGFFGGSLSYVGNQEGTFQLYSGPPQPPPPRQYYPPYAKTDLRSGLKYDSWTLNLYVNNLADKRGLLLGGLDATPPYGFQYITPRTIGVSAAKSF